MADMLKKAAIRFAENRMAAFFVRGKLMSVAEDGTIA
jgi:hypothetical protein